MIDRDFQVLATPRLTLRRLRPADAAAIAAYRGLPEVMRYQSWERYGPAEARALVADMAGRHPGAPNAWFQFAAALGPAEGPVVGDLGLAVRDGAGEIGFTFAPEAQGRGLATEAASALLGYAFCRLGLARIVAECDPRNERSVRLLRRLGFVAERHLRGTAWYKGEWTDELIFGLSAQGWRESAGGRGAPMA
ncbi:MAG TPA: GNAT family protein [Alphaproteobacteria bacterium]|nr:GNAT family protein [Alphaproteobacteria bacterium]